MSSELFSDEPNVKRKCSKHRKRNNQSHTPGGLIGRKIRYDVTKLANELADTDCENPRKPHEIPEINFYNC